MLQFPTFHFNSGSGHAVQNQPEENSEPRLQPLHCSTISWQIPPLYVQPLDVMKGHSIPSLIVVQTNLTTSFANNKNLKKGRKFYFRPPLKRGFQKRWNIIMKICLVNKNLFFKTIVNQTVGYFSYLLFQCMLHDKF